MSTISAVTGQNFLPTVQANGVSPAATGYATAVGKLLVGVSYANLVNALNESADTDAFQILAPINSQLFVNTGSTTSPVYKLLDYTGGSGTNVQTITGGGTGTLGGAAVAPETGTLISGNYINVRITGVYYGNTKISGSDGKLYWLPPANQSGLIQAFNVKALDNGNGVWGDSNDSTSTGTVAVSINVTNNAPVNTVPGAQTGNVNGDVTFSGNISVSDADTSQLLTVTLTATSSDSQGVLTLGGTTGLSNLSGNGSSLVSFTGTQANINTALNGLYYNGTFGQTGNVQIQTTDGVATDTDSVAIGLAAPTVVSVTIGNTGSGTGGTFRAGDFLYAYVQFDQNVNLTDYSSKLKLHLSDSVANGASGDVLASLWFNNNGSIYQYYGYTIQAGDLDVNGVSIPSNPLVLNTDTIVATNGGAGANLTYAGTADNAAAPVDAQPPNAPGTPDLLTADDSGTSNTDNYTNVTSPHFTMSIAGTNAVAGNVLTLHAFDGTTDVTASYTLTTTDISNNSASITSAALTNGHTYSVTATVTDAAGNVSTASSALAGVVIDTSAPNAPAAPDLQTADDTGITSDNITSVTAPHFDISLAGTNAVVGDHLTLHANDGTTDVTATYTLTTTDTITNGYATVQSGTLTTAHTYSVTATITDAAGNLSAASSGLSVMINTSAPNAPGTPDLIGADDSGSSSTDNYTNVTAPHFQMSLSGTNAVAGDTISIDAFDGVATHVTASYVLTSTDVTTNGYASVMSGALTDGSTYSVTSTITNTVGSTSSASSALTGVHIDTTAPTAPNAPDLLAASDTGTSSTDDYTGDNTPTLRVDLTGTNAVAGDIVKLYFHTIGTLGASFTLTGTEIGQGYVDLTSSTVTDGAHTFDATITDVAGNVSTVSAGLAVTIDTTAPNAPGTPDLQTADDSSTGLGFGTSSDDITSNTTPHFDISLAGTNAVAGDSLTLHANDGTTDVTVSYTLTSTDIGNNTVAVMSGTLTDGHTYSVTATVTDQAGNVSTSSSALASVVIDTTAPTQTVGSVALSNDTGSSSSDFVVNTATQHLTGTLSATLGSSEHLFLSADAGSTWMDITSSVTGTAVDWTASGLITDNNANAQFVFSVQDLAGNAGSSTQANYLIDTSLPTASLGADFYYVDSSNTTHNNTAWGSTINSSTITFNDPTAQVADSGATTNSGVAAGNSVKVYDSTDGGTTWNPTPVGTFTASTWNNGLASVSGLQNGAHTLRVDVNDVAGNVGSSTTQTVTVTAPPSETFDGARLDLANHILYLYGANMNSILDVGQNSGTDIRNNLDMSKLIYKMDVDLDSNGNPTYNYLYGDQNANPNTNGNLNANGYIHLTSAQVLDNNTLALYLNSNSQFFNDPHLGTRGHSPEDGINIIDGFAHNQGGRDSSANTNLSWSNPLNVIGDINQSGAPRDLHIDMSMGNFNASWFNAPRDMVDQNTGDTVASTDDGGPFGYGPWSLGGGGAQLWGPDHGYDNSVDHLTIEGLSAAQANIVADTAYDHNGWVFDNNGHGGYGDHFGVINFNYQNANGYYWGNQNLGFGQGNYNSNFNNNSNSNQIQHQFGVTSVDGTPINLDSTGTVTISFADGSVLKINQSELLYANGAEVGGQMWHNGNGMNNAPAGVVTNLGHYTKETLVGTSHDDKLIAGDAGDRLLGAGGQDVLIGGRGADSIYSSNGSPGFDNNGNWVSSATASTIWGRAGADYISLKAGSNTLEYTWQTSNSNNNAWNNTNTNSNSAPLYNDGRDVIVGFKAGAISNTPDVINLTDDRFWHFGYNNDGAIATALLDKAQGNLTAFDTSVLSYTHSDIKQAGADTLIILNNQESIRLVNVQMTALTSDNFGHSDFFFAPGSMLG